MIFVSFFSSLLSWATSSTSLDVFQCRSSLSEKQLHLFFNSNGYCSITSGIFNLLAWYLLTCNALQPSLLCIEIGTRATLFLWSKWLAAWFTGACAQRRRRTTTKDVAQHVGHNTKSCSLGLQHISLISDMHIVQLAAVISSNPLTSIT